MSDQPAFHLAQVNIARARFSIDDPGMADFMNQLDEINALADAAPGLRLAPAGRQRQRHQFPAL